MDSSRLVCACVCVCVVELIFLLPLITKAAGEKGGTKYIDWFPTWKQFVTQQGEALRTVWKGGQRVGGAPHSHDPLHAATWWPTNAAALVSCCPLGFSDFDTDIEQMNVDYVASWSQVSCGHRAAHDI